MVFAALIAMLMFVGCGGSNTFTSDSFVVEQNVLEVADDVSTSTVEKVSFKDIKLSYIDGKRTFSFTEVNNIKDEIFQKKVTSTIQGEISLKQWLFVNIDYWNIYILDQYGNYLEYFSQLEYGKTYTIIDEEYKFNQIVLKAEQSFVFSEDYDGKVFSLKLEVQDFFVELEFDFLEEIYSISESFGDYENNINFKLLDPNKYTFTAHLNQEYIIETYSGDRYKISMDQSNMFHYLSIGEIQINKLGGIGGVTWDSNNISYEKALEGIDLKYDSIIPEGNSFSFKIDIKMDSFLYYSNNDGKQYYEQDNVQIFVDDKDGNYKPWDGTMISAGSIVYVDFVNSLSLSDSIQIVEEAPINPECDEVMEALGSCETSKVENDVETDEPIKQSDAGLM